MTHQAKSHHLSLHSRPRVGEVWQWLIPLIFTLCLAWPSLAQTQAAANTADRTPSKPTAKSETNSANNRRAVRIARKLASKSDQPPTTNKPQQSRTNSPTAANSSPTAADSQSTDSSNLESTPLGSPANAGKPSGISNQTFGSGGGWVLNTLTALGVVIALVFLLKWAYQKLSGARAVAPSSAVEVLCRTSVAPKNHVMLLRVGQRVLVVSDSSQGLRTLSELDDPEEVASVLQSVTAERDNSLSDNFNRLISRYRDEHEPAQSAGSNQAQMDRTHSEVSSLLGRVRSMSRAGKGGGT